MTEAARQMTNADLPRDQRRCAGTTSAGDPCGAGMLRYDEETEAWWCISHNPDEAVRAIALAAAQRGGISTKLRNQKIKVLDPGELGPLLTLADAQRQLAIVAAAVAEGRLASPQGNAITQAVRAWMAATQAHDDRQTLNAIVKLLEDRTSGEGGGDVLASLRRIVQKGRGA